MRMPETPDTYSTSQFRSNESPTPISFELIRTQPQHGRLRRGSHGLVAYPATSLNVLAACDDSHWAIGVK